MLLAPLAVRATAQHFIISAQQVALVKVTHETSFLWQTLFLRRTRQEESRGPLNTNESFGGEDVEEEMEEVALFKKKKRKKNSKGNSKGYALLRGVNGFGMNIKAH